MLWEPFTLTAAAATLQADAPRAVLGLLVPPEAMAYLSYDGNPLQETIVPLIDLGNMSELSDAVLDAIYGEAASQEPFTAEFPHEFGLSRGNVWVRPGISHLDTFRSRLAAALATHGATPLEDSQTTLGASEGVPSVYYDREPREFVLDRLAVSFGDTVMEVPLGSLAGSGSALRADGSLAFDGDLLSALGEDDASPYVSPIDITDKKISTVMGTGASFVIPLLVPEGVPTGDGRIFDPLSLTTRDLPLPLMWQIKSGTGHDGSVLVGRIDHVERVSQGLGNARGVFDSGPYGREAERLVRSGMLRGVSADLDQFQAETNTPIPQPAADSSDSADDAKPTARKEKIGNTVISVSNARVMGATLVPRPAFQECFIELTDTEIQESYPEEPIMADGVYTETPSGPDSEALTACALIASHIPVTPPRTWFENPRLTGPTPLSVDDDGKVFGHIAAWHVDHIGLPFGTRPPRSRSNYSYFHTGVLRTDEGADVPVGQLTLAGGHAPLEASASEAVKHYDDTASAIADVHAGEDAYGIWVAGALRPGVSPEQIRSLRASAPSGDWRPIQGRLELVAVCQVNVPGFPIARARVASGMVTALVAAGASSLAELQERRTVSVALHERELAAKHQEVIERMEQARAERDTAQSQQLQALAASAATRVQAARTSEYTEFKVFSKDTREKYAREGWALPDGSYPIKDVADLRRAIRSYGRAKPEHKATVRKHIIRRARGLGRADLIPESWAVTAAARARVALTASIDAPLDIETVEDGMVAALHFRRKRIFNEQLHPRDESGKFRKVLFRLQQDLQGQTGTKKALEAIERAQDAENSGDLDAAKDAADDVIDLVDDIADNTADLDLKDSLRQGSSALGKVMAYLPLAQGDTTAKMRFTDLPVELRDLIDDLLERAERKMEPADFKEQASDLLAYKSGGDFMFSDEIQSHCPKLLRFLV